MADQVELVGADRLAATLASAAAQLDDMRELHQVIGDVIVAAAGPLTPRRTGALVARTTAVAGPKSVDITNQASYAIPVHFGARGKAARPFLTEAGERTQNAQVAAATTKIQDVLDTVKGA